MPVCATDMDQGMDVPVGHLKRRLLSLFHRPKLPAVAIPNSPQGHSQRPVYPNHMEAIKVTDRQPTDTSALVSQSSSSPCVVNAVVPLFALIIGIDGYTNCKPLRGAIADAKDIKSYLREVLRVPERHIHTLLDEEATRSAIIKAFRGLRDDQRIQYGDPIVIFYAGHGSELDPPHAWDVQGKIQCLLPCDYKRTYVIDNKVTTIQPIPDLTIGTLIEDIAKIKGDNITVIFDCCHSASGTRFHNNAYVPRTVVLDHSLAEDIDNDIWGGRAGHIPQSLAHHGLQSHVLLAACGEKELAYEHNGRGRFTTELLSTLRNSAVSNLTYTEVLKRIHLTEQHPHCEGKNRHRVLFNARVSASRQVRHSIHVYDCKYVITAGLAHGVSRGVEFTLYSNDRQGQDIVVVDDTAVIENFQTTVITPMYLAKDSFARLTRIGKLPFYLSPGGSLKETVHGMNVLLAKKAEDAKLEITENGQRAAFKILDQRVNEFGLTWLPHTVLHNHVVHVLTAAEHYYWYLDLTNRNSRIGINHPVSVDFYRLEIDYDDYGNEIFVPVVPGFCRKDPNSDSDVIDFVVDPQEIFGIKVTNNTSWDLYLNAFLFNNNSFSIESYYTQSSAGNPDAPLKRNGIFTIGYGPGGTAPFAYSLEDGQNVDVSYLKIFFATRPIDLSGLAQTTPFVDMEGRDSEEDIARKARLCVSPLKQAPPEPVDTWFTVQIPVVQRRG